MERPHFYSRPCGRGDTFGPARYVCSCLFLLTPLREGRPCPAGRTDSARVYFYSRPCGRGDKQFAVCAAQDAISTHAPAGGATCASPPATGMSIVFLLTPLREGRPGRMAWSARHRDFYSRPCGRGDQELLNSYQNSIISTHAPAGGATDLVGHRFGVAQFLLTPLREGRRSENGIAEGSLLFLLTPLREGRPPPRP